MMDEKIRGAHRQAMKMALMDGKPTDFDTIYFQVSSSESKARALGAILRATVIGESKQGPGEGILRPQVILCRHLILYHQICARGE